MDWRWKLLPGADEASNVARSKKQEKTPNTGGIAPRKALGCIAYHCDGCIGREKRGRRSSGDGKRKEVGGLESEGKKRTGKKKIWTRRRNFQNAKTCRQLPRLPRISSVLPILQSTVHYRECKRLMASLIVETRSTSGHWQKDPLPATYSPVALPIGSTIQLLCPEQPTQRTHSSN